MPQNTKNSQTAAIIIIGNEILSGRTADENTPWIAAKLTAHGVKLIEMRVVPDIKERIIEAVQALRTQADYVFTTGGIGPTHDDITAESMAKAFDVELARNEEAYQMLVDRWGEDKIKGAASKMTMIPKGASLISNGVTGAPGFILGNVYVMAGVPSIMQSMFNAALEGIERGETVLSYSISTSLPESTVANDLGALQEKYPKIDIGSYPYFRMGMSGLNVVLRGTEADTLQDIADQLLDMIANLGDENAILSVQGGA